MIFTRLELALLLTELRLARGRYRERSFAYEKYDQLALRIEEHIFPHLILPEPVEDREYRKDREEDREGLYR